MNKQWWQLDLATQQTIQQNCVDHLLAQHWLEQMSRITLRRLYGYALDMHCAYAADIRSALDTDNVLQQRYWQILDHLNLATFVNAAAAATEPAQLAEGSCTQNGVHLRYRLEGASAVDNECYLIIEVGAETSAPTRLSARSKMHGFAEIELDTMHKNTIQMVFQSSDSIVKILQDADRLVKLW